MLARSTRDLLNILDTVAKAGADFAGDTLVDIARTYNVSHPTIANAMTVTVLSGPERRTLDHG